MSAQAGEQIVLSISPPLIKVNMNPGDSWNGSINLVNNNSQVITVYVQSADFKSGDQGGVEFIPSDQSASYKYSLAKWLEYDPAPIEIAPQETKEIPFTIKLPADAEPGGHYAAMLAGTKAPDTIQGSGIKISSMLASLIMLEVSGDVLQKGEIKEFSTDKNFYSEPEVKFNINFSNSGNIHLQPRGEIKIYNFFNKEEGEITINQQTEYGNVLPQSQRKWEFSWEGKKNIFNMGRFKAISFLTFGEKAQETVSQTVYFWVIYLKPLIILLISFLLLIFLVVFSIRRYVRRAIIRAQNSIGMISTPKENVVHKISVIPDETSGNRTSANIKTYVRPALKVEIPEKKDYEAPGFAKFFLAVICALIVVAGIAVFLYYNGYLKIFNNQKETNNNLTPAVLDNKQADDSLVQNEIIENKDVGNIDASSSAEISDNQAKKDEEPADMLATSTEQAEKEVSSSSVAVVAQDKAVKESVIAVLNGSGVEGAAKLVEGKINSIGLKTGSLGNADHYGYINSVIKYKKDSRTQAEKIGALFGKSVEFQEITKSDYDIIVIIGSSFK